MNTFARLIALVLLAGLLPPAALGADQPAGKADHRDGILAIQVVKDPTDDFDWKGLAFALIGAETGGRPTAADAEKAVALLKDFGTVVRQGDDAGQGAATTLLFTPFKRIKSIAISGNYPLFEKEVRNVLTIAPGDFFRQEQVQAQKKLVIQRYREEGYIDPKVAITWNRDEDDGNFELSIRIDKGAYYRIDDIRFRGNRNIPDPLLKGRMSTWRRYAGTLGSGGYVSAQLQKDVNDLKSMYRQQGYADVEITATVRTKKEKAIADITITVQEGPRYVVRFNGNHFFSDGDLQDDMVLDKAGNRSNIGIRRSLQAIKRRYLEAGFADVRLRWHEASPEKEDTDENRRIVVVDVKEGLRHIVGSLDIKGNKRLDEETIRGQILTRPGKTLSNGVFIADRLREDIDALRALYVQHGFLEAQVAETVHFKPTERNTLVDIVLTIDEGVKTRVSAVDIQGTDGFADLDLRSGLQLGTGALYRPYLLARDEESIASAIAPLGYPHVRVRSAAALSEDHTAADITYHVDPGPAVRVGSIFFTGQFRTRKSILVREMAVKKGAPFSLAGVIRSQNNLRNLGLFDSVQVRTIGLKEKADVVHLLVQLVEKKPYTFELAGGYQTDKGAYVRSRISDSNFTGTNKEVWLGGELSDVGYRLETGMANPRLFGLDLRTDTGLFIERREDFNQDFGTDTRGGTLSITKPWGHGLSSSLGFRLEQREQYLRETKNADEIDPDTLERRTVVIATPSIRFDNRDSFIRPRKGMLGSLTVDISNDLENGVDNFIKYRLDLRGFYPLRPKLTLAARLWYGYLQSYGDSGKIPKDQLFFLGGTNDVRGFEENLLRFDEDGIPVGGRMAANGSIEARYELGKNMELNLFVDCGTVQEADADAGGDDDYRWTTGLGLRYLTPVGPIGILYGHKLDSREDESSGQFHFSIGYTF